jgi:hypothetical protein
MNRAPPLRRRKLAPRSEVGADASFKKLASDEFTQNFLSMSTPVKSGANP